MLQLCALLSAVLIRWILSNPNDTFGASLPVSQVTAKRNEYNTTTTILKSKSKFRIIIIFPYLGFAFRFW
jgi:hypothetical protein